jgi:hypothetical protein
MKPRALAAAICFAFMGGCEKDPMAQTGDLWPGYHRYSTTALPTTDDIERACAKAESRFKEEFERQQGAYVDVEPDYLGSTVKGPQCSWEQGAAVTASCRFEMAPIYASLPGSDEVATRPKPGDWRPMEARLVRVRGPVPWIAAKGCAPR